MNNNPLRFVDPFGLCGGEQQGPSGDSNRAKSAREAAARRAIENIISSSIAEDREYAGAIYRDKTDDSYGYTLPRPGDDEHSQADLRQLTRNQELVGLYHTHGDSTLYDKIFGYSDHTFSKSDKAKSEEMKVPMYLGNPFRDLLVYDPAAKPKIQDLGKVR